MQTGKCRAHRLLFPGSCGGRHVNICYLVVYRQYWKEQCSSCRASSCWSDLAVYRVRQRNSCRKKAAQQRNRAEGRVAREHFVWMSWVVIVTFICRKNAQRPSGQFGTLDTYQLAATLDTKQLAATLDAQQSAATLDTQHLAATLDTQQLAATLDIEQLTATLDIQYLLRHQTQNSCCDTRHTILAATPDTQYLLRHQAHSKMLPHYRRCNM